MTASLVPASLAWLRLRPFAAGLLGLNTAVLCLVVHGESDHTGIHHPSTQGTLLALSVLTGAVLGIVAWWDGFTRDGWSLLAHQAVSRAEVFASRLLVGLGLHAAVLGLPWLLVSAYHATPGAVAAPYFPEMTGVGLVWILAGVPVHLGAVATVFRQARWFGTRGVWLAGALMTASAAVGARTLPETLGWLLGASVILLVAAWLGFRTRATRSGWDAADRWLNRGVLSAVAGVGVSFLLLGPPLVAEVAEGFSRIREGFAKPSYELRNDGAVVVRTPTDEIDASGERRFHWTDRRGHPTEPADQVATLSGSLHRGRWAAPAWVELAGLYQEVRDVTEGRGYLDFRREVAVVYDDRARGLGRTPLSIVRLPTAVGEPARTLLDRRPPLAGRTMSGPRTELFGVPGVVRPLLAVHVEQDRILAEDVHRVTDGVAETSADRLYQARWKPALVAGLTPGEPVGSVVVLGRPTGLSFAVLHSGGGVTTLPGSPALPTTAAGGWLEVVLTDAGGWAVLQRGRGGEPSFWWTSEALHGPTQAWTTLPPLRSDGGGRGLRGWLQWLPPLAAPAWWHTPWTLEPLWGRSPWPAWLLLTLAALSGAAAVGVRRVRRLPLAAASSVLGGFVLGPAFPLALLLERAPRTVAASGRNGRRSAGPRVWAPAA